MHRKFNAMVWVVLSALWMEALHAQFSVLTDFTHGEAFTGANTLVEEPLYFDGTWLYGVNTRGGFHDYGTVYKVKPDGTGFVKLIDFNGANGRFPRGGLISDGIYLYGTTEKGGDSDRGIIYKIKPDGTSFTILSQSPIPCNSFTGGLLLDGGRLYGYAESGKGVLFRAALDGGGLTILRQFNDVLAGQYPTGTLIRHGDYLYGVTRSGGMHDDGVAFKIKQDGTGYKKLCQFDEPFTGKSPTGSLIYHNGFLYGLFRSGGPDNAGGIFRVDEQGNNFWIQHYFDPSSNGGSPRGSLIKIGNRMYGVTSTGGAHNAGTLFSVNEEGQDLQTIRHFEYGTAGANPIITPVYDGTWLYSATYSGGQYLGGNIFKCQPDGTGLTAVFDFRRNSHGSQPYHLLMDDQGVLYGNANVGGLDRVGVLYALNADGSDFRSLADFEESSTGKYLFGRLVSDGIYLYGVAIWGGQYGGGTLYKVKKDGSDLSILYHFRQTEPYYPIGITRVNDYLYGVTSLGGLYDNGVIYRINTDGSDFTVLSDLNPATHGRDVMDALIYDGNSLYGISQFGGPNHKGVLFKMSLDGLSFTSLYEFGDQQAGQRPFGQPLLREGVLYVKTLEGGVHNRGSLLRINTDGSGLTKLHDFDANAYTAYADLVFHDDYLYGGTYAGGYSGHGTLYRIRPDGTGFELMKEFDGHTGAYPSGTLLSHNGVLFGTALQGGKANAGVVFGFKPCIPVETDVFIDRCYGDGIIIDGLLFTSDSDYTSYVTGTAGCDTIRHYHLDFGEAITNTIVEMDTVLHATQPGGQYQWVTCFDYVEIPGETNLSFTPTEPGYYAVIADYNGCPDTSGCYYMPYVKAGFTDPEVKLRIAPNPNTGEFDIQPLVAMTISGVEIYNFSGSVVMRLDEDEITPTIDVRALPTGVYVVSVVTSRGTFRVKMMKR